MNGKILYSIILDMERLVVKKSNIIGKGIFITTPIKKGDFIAYIHGPVIVFKNITPSISKKMINWIGVGRWSWINTDDSIFRFINHSCDPNVVIRGRRRVEALRDIPANTEILMDYSLTEAEPGWEIKECVCDSKNCRKSIGPIWTLPNSTYKKYSRLISKKFQKIYETDHI